MTKILIGRGVTDANGVATMTEDANGNPVNGYVGTGAGKVDLSAGVTIDGRTFQSEIYSTIDAMFKDIGIQSDHNPNWGTSQSGSLTVYDTYSEILETGTANILYYPKSSSNQIMSFVGDVTLELDIKLVEEVYNSAFIDIRNFNTSSELISGISGNNCDIKDADWHHLKIEIRSDYITIHNGTYSKQLPNTLSSDEKRIGFWTSGNITKLQFRNFVIYPI